MVTGAVYSNTETLRHTPRTQDVILTTIEISVDSATSETSILFCKCDIPPRKSLGKIGIAGTKLIAG